MIAQDRVVAYPAQQFVASAAGTATQADIVIINHYHDKVEKYQSEYEKALEYFLK